MLLVTQDDLERMAFEAGATIELRPTRAFATISGITYASPLKSATP